jgi:hypothetical protein
MLSSYSYYPSPKDCPSNIFAVGGFVTFTVPTVTEVRERVSDDGVREYVCVSSMSEVLGISQMRAFSRSKCLKS